MKNILVVSPCSRRRNTIGLVGNILNTLHGLDKHKYHISLFDTNFFDDPHQSNDYPCDTYFGLPERRVYKLARKIPIIRSHYACKLIIKQYKQILSNNKFDFVLIHQVPGYADQLVFWAHKYEAKIIFEPFGSDILRADNNTRDHLKKAFSEVDAVVGREQSNVMIAADEVYGVPEEKLKKQKIYLSGIKILKEISGKYSREEMTNSLGLKYSDYNIVCGYSGRESHRHNLIVDALIEVKNELPEGYQIIFPMTYGAGTHHEIIINYATKLRTRCEEAGLNALFITDFKTSEQMAYLHLVTDLFIEIQPSDNGNAFMIEALFAQNQIVTGRWLKYKRFEQFGVPYYLIDTPQDLSTMLHNIFTHQIEKAKIPQQLINFFDVPDGFNHSTFWEELFNTL